MDYRELLVKYIAHVGDCEGVTFMPRDNYPNSDSVEFTPEEVEELHKLDDESRKFER